MPRRQPRSKPLEVGVYVGDALMTLLSSSRAYAESMLPVPCRPIKRKVYLNPQERLLLGRMGRSIFAVNGSRVVR